MPTAAEIADAVYNSPHPMWAGRTLAQQLEHTRLEVNSSRDHLQLVIQGTSKTTTAAIVEAVLNTPIPRGGAGQGATSLAGLIAWHDDGTQRLLNGQAAGGDVDPDAIRAAVTASVEAALADLTITITPKG